MTKLKLKRKPLPAPGANEPPMPESLAPLAFSIAELVPDPANAREHGERNLEAVKASLAEYGWRGVVVVRARDHVILSGNARIEAAKALGWTRAPVLFVADDKKRGTAYAIADNRTAELATWNLQQLLINLKDLEGDEELMASVGFSDYEISEMRGLSPEATERVDDPPAAPSANPTAKSGELWILGQHRLLCGDSTNLEHVRALMDGHRAALCATDPPYCIDYTGERPNGTGKDWTGNYREIDIEDPIAFFRATFTMVLEVLQPRGAIYCWHAAKRAGDIQRIWRELGILDHQQIVWVKPSAVFGRSYWHFRHEPCLMGWRQGDKPANPTSHDNDSVWEVDFRRAPGDQAAAGKKRRRRGDAAEQEKHDDVWRVDWEGKSRVIGNEHPTQKPVELFARPMRAHTDPGEVCFEPFCGSGSQLIAAEMTGRRCFAMELQPAFVDVAVRRWEGLTGKKARRQKVKLAS